MPQISKGARLYVYKRKGRPKMYFIRDGKVFRSTGCTVGELDAANEALKRYLENKPPDTSKRDNADIAVADVMNLYNRDQASDKPTKALIKFHIKRLEVYWGDKSLADVKGSTCRSYKASRLRNGVKESTVRRELKTLQAAINHWHKESPLKVVPKVTLPAESLPRDRILERAEVARMLRACRKRKWHYVARFILIGVQTGTRHDAILSLQWEKALHGGHVDLQRGILYRRGSAERETSKRRTPVQIPRLLHRLLQGWAKRDAQHNFSHIIHYRGGAVKGKIRKAWRTICEDAGLGEDVKPHTLRHTCATWNLWAGKTIWDVGGIIGADATTVQKVYGHHLIRDEEKKA